MVARAAVTNPASSCSTARRVAGNEPAKITTPMKPLIQPLADRSTPVLLKVPDDAWLHLYGSIQRGTTPATIQYSRK